MTVVSDRHRFLNCTMFTLTPTQPNVSTPAIVTIVTPEFVKVNEANGSQAAGC